MIKVGIIGGAGYTAGELIRILLNHSSAQIASVVSKSHSGQKVYEAHSDLLGETELVFTEELSNNVDVVFLCSGHGKSKEVMAQNIIPKTSKVIDLSTDFRLKNTENKFIYGLPELNKEQIRSAKKVANPGCFATCIQLGLLPLASSEMLKKAVHTSAITGSTGAGQKPTETTHFSWRSNNASVYKALTHQHLGEIRQSMKQLHQNFDTDIHFIPFRGAFTRGIIATSYTESDLKLEEAIQLYENFYKEHPFVHVSEKVVDIKQVVNTNKALIYLQKEGSQLVITSVIDNLLKGASGQAVQNMNLMFGLEETTGLQLKGSAF